MNPVVWGVLGTIVTGLFAVFVARQTGLWAKKTAEVNVASQALSQVVPIWQATIDQMGVTIEDLKIAQKDQAGQIGELQAKDRINVAWKQAALAHILALHTYIRLHLHRDDIPAVPPELAPDIPPFSQSIVNPEGI